MRYYIIPLILLPIIVLGIVFSMAFPNIAAGVRDGVMHYPIATTEFVTSKTQQLSMGASAIYHDTEGKVSNALDDAIETVSNTKSSVENSFSLFATSTNRTLSNYAQSIAAIPDVAMVFAQNKLENVNQFTSRQWTNISNISQKILVASQSSLSGLKDKTLAQWQGIKFQDDKFERVVNNTVEDNSQLSTDDLAAIEPALGAAMADEPPSEFSYEFEIEDSELLAEAVLVPREKTVISSSRDGKIKQIYFDNGDTFKEGDIILEYYCEDSKAELEAVRAERKFAREKQAVTSRLFDLDLASGLEIQQSQIEKKMAEAKREMAESRLNDCIIRADYDGRVVKKLANDNEYTRTDRVLMEVASKGTLDVEFLLPSRALRWINIGAPITLTLSETDRDYTGEIKRIYGEVDPVSQSIQIRAGLDDYPSPLLPGMSGQITVNVEDIRAAGISGFLETQL